MRNENTDGYLPISDYGLIGDCHSAALVARDGAIDWFCPGRFDAPAVFCRVLDAEKGGSLLLRAEGDATYRRRYVGDTNILETTIEGEGRTSRLTDFMPIVQNPEGKHGSSELPGGRIVRRLEAIEGGSDFTVEFRPTFEYAAHPAEFTEEDGGLVLAERNGTIIGLAVENIAETSTQNGVWKGRLHLDEGDVVWLSLAACGERSRVRDVLRGLDGDSDLEHTAAYWQRWTDRCAYEGRHRDEVMRSILALKLLTYEPTGAIVAAPTTSLPEQIGGERNWDYRFTWLRDSSLILYALLTVGYSDEAVDFIGWLRRTVGKNLDQTPQIMYTIEGDSELPERELQYLSGYRGSRPVRVGNAASNQRQLDIFGEVMASAFIHYDHSGAHNGHPAKKGIGTDRPDDPTWALLRALVNDAAEHWQEPDEGIWEVRGGPQQFVYSKLMCWVALDRGIKLAEQHNLEADTRRWRQTRDEIRHAIETRGYNEKIGAFVQSFGSSTLDASLLAVPRVGFLPATDPRVLSTIDCICRDLTVNGLTYRYRTQDGLQGTEGAFLLCTFWLVEALALAGRVEEADHLFDHTAKHANDLGLFSEEIDPRSGAFLGNFPQGFTHLSLIRAAGDLRKARHHGPENDRHTESDRLHRTKQAVKHG